MKKKAVVVHSGGMDSSICLALAIHEFGAEGVTSLSFDYGQRHQKELECAQAICKEWQVDHKVVSLDFYSKIASSALIGNDCPFAKSGDTFNTLVMGRNGLLAHIAGIAANHLGAHYIYMGVLGIEETVSGYRDCSRSYMDHVQELLKIDLDDSLFEIRTPLVAMSKKETLEVAHHLGVLSFLLQTTLTCYDGVPKQGCLKCLACQFRLEGLNQFVKAHPEVVLPYLPARQI